MKSLTLQDDRLLKLSGKQAACESMWPLFTSLASLVIGYPGGKQTDSAATAVLEDICGWGGEESPMKIDRVNRVFCFVFFFYFYCSDANFILAQGKKM